MEDEGLYPLKQSPLQTLGEGSKRDFKKDRRTFVKVIDKILKKDIENLRIPHKRFIETKKKLVEIIREEKARFTDCDFVFDLPISETEFLEVFLKYLPTDVDFTPYSSYIRRLESSSERTYLTPSGNIIKFLYE